MESVSIMILVHYLPKDYCYLNIDWIAGFGYNLIETFCKLKSVWIKRASHWLIKAGIAWKQENFSLKATTLDVFGLWFDLKSFI